MSVGGTGVSVGGTGVFVGRASVSAVDEAVGAAHAVANEMTDNIQIIGQRDV